MSLADRDRAVLWHPYTQMLTAPEPLEIERGEGVWLYTSDGRKILDGISSWWVNIHGHSHPKLNAALARHGPNRLESDTALGPWRLLGQQFRNPLVLMLIFGGSVSAALREWVDDTDAMPADFDALAARGEQSWREEREAVLLYC